MFQLSSDRYPSDDQSQKEKVESVMTNRSQLQHLKNKMEPIQDNSM